MKNESKTAANHNEQTDRIESQRYFHLKHGLSPRLMNQLESLGVITSMPRTNPKGTKYYLVNDTWDSIVAYMHKPNKIQESTSFIAAKKSQSEKYKLKRRTKNA